MFAASRIGNLGVFLCQTSMRSVCVCGLGCNRPSSLGNYELKDMTSFLCIIHSIGYTYLNSMDQNKSKANVLFLVLTCP